MNGLEEGLSSKVNIILYQDRILSSGYKLQTQELHILPVLHYTIPHPEFPSVETS